MRNMSAVGLPSSLDPKLKIITCHERNSQQENFPNITLAFKEHWNSQLLETVTGIAGKTAPCFGRPQKHLVWSWTEANSIVQIYQLPCLDEHGGGEPPGCSCSIPRGGKVDCDQMKDWIRGNMLETSGCCSHVIKVFLDKFPVITWQIGSERMCWKPTGEVHMVNLSLWLCERLDQKVCWKSICEAHSTGLISTDIWHGGSLGKSAAILSLKADRLRVLTEYFKDIESWETGEVEEVCDTGKRESWETGEVKEVLVPGQKGGLTGLAFIACTKSQQFSEVTRWEIVQVTIAVTWGTVHDWSDRKTNADGTENSMWMFWTFAFRYHTLKWSSGMVHNCQFPDRQNIYYTTIACRSYVTKGPRRWSLRRPSNFQPPTTSHKHQCR